MGSSQSNLATPIFYMWYCFRLLFSKVGYSRPFFFSTDYIFYLYPYLGHASAKLSPTRCRSRIRKLYRDSTVTHPLLYREISDTNPLTPLEISVTHPICIWGDMGYASKRSLWGLRLRIRMPVGRISVTRPKIFTHPLWIRDPCNFF